MPQLAQSFADLLTPSDLDHFMVLPEVLRKREDLAESLQVDFEAQLPDATRARLSRALGIDMASTVPLRWIRSDSEPHVDHAWDQKPHHTTFLVYLHGDGSLQVGNEEYPIIAGQGYAFAAGLVHSTCNTTQDRLIMGPFSERQTPVGAFMGITYWESASVQNMIYFQAETSGTLLSVGEINAINQNPQDPRHLNGFSATIPVPPGQSHIGWAFTASRSFGRGILNGVVPTNAAFYPINAAFLLSFSDTISLYPIFGTPPRRRWTRLGKGSWPKPRYSRNTRAFGG